jgi:hypothetical protein
MLVVPEVPVLFANDSVFAAGEELVKLTVSTPVKPKPVTSDAVV